MNPNDRMILTLATPPSPYPLGARGGAAAKDGYGSGQIGAGRPAGWLCVRLPGVGWADPVTLEMSVLTTL